MEEVAVTSLNPKFHSVVQFIENRDPNISSTDLISNATNSSSKKGRLKCLKNEVIILRGESSKFKMKASSRVSIFEAMTKLTNRNWSEDLNAKENNLQREPMEPNEPSTLDA